MRGMWRAGISRGVAVICVVMGCGAVTGARTWAQAAVKAQEGARRGEAPAVQALLVSDIHFEPFWDPAKVERLAAAPVAEWKTILAEPDAADRRVRFAQLEQLCHARGDDTSYALYRSSLTAMQAHAADAKFVMVSGDLMAHAFSCKYTAILPKAGPGAYRSFAEKTVEYVIESLRGALPGVPVFAALGNNDSDCGDYRLDARGEFLATEGSVFARGFARGDREEAVRTFALGGYYGVSLPAPMRKTRLLVLDDLFMSRRYETCGGKQDGAPAGEQIAWLEQQLESARKRGEKVWMMAHIPPGVDPYSTAIQGKDVCAGGKPAMFLSSEALPETLGRFGDVIRLAIFAHTHMDEVRLMEPAQDDTKLAGVAVKMVPSISPINGNNPSFTVATIDAETATMNDYRVIAASSKAGADATWAEEYDFATTYKEQAFSAATVRDLIGQFSVDRGAQNGASQSYIRNYDVGQPIRELGLIWPMYACALENDEASAFQSCVCSAKH